MQMKPLLPPIMVNGVTLDAARIASEVQNHPAPKGKPGLAWNAAARALVIRELLMQEAGRRGIIAVPVEIEPGRHETEDDAVIRQLLEVAVTLRPADEKALEAVYQAHPEQFRAPSLYEAAHILFAAAPDDTEARGLADEGARKVLALLSQKPQRFAELAAEYSACSSKSTGGMLGQLSSGDTVPEFETALALIKEGTIAPEPVQTRYGLHVIRLDARITGDVLPFQSILPHLREAYEKSEWVRASRAYLAELVAAADISGLSLGQSSEPAPAEGALA